MSQMTELFDLDEVYHIFSEDYLNTINGIYLCQDSSSCLITAIKKVLLLLVLQVQQLPLQINFGLKFHHKIYQYKTKQVLLDPCLVTVHNFSLKLVVSLLKVLGLC